MHNAAKEEVHLFLKQIPVLAQTNFVIDLWENVEKKLDAMFVDTKKENDVAIDYFSLCKRRDALDTYRRQMKRDPEMGPPFYLDKDLKAKHERVTDEILSQLAAEPLDGPKELIDEICEETRKEMEERFQLVKESNEVDKTFYCRQAAQRALELYYSQMQIYLSRSDQYSSDTIREEHQRLRHEALDMLEGDTLLTQSREIDAVWEEVNKQIEDLLRDIKYSRKSWLEDAKEETSVNLKGIRMVTSVSNEGARLQVSPAALANFANARQAIREAPAHLESKKATSERSGGFLAKVRRMLGANPHTGEKDTWRRPDDEPHRQQLRCRESYRQVDPDQSERPPKKASSVLSCLTGVRE